MTKDEALKLAFAKVRAAMQCHPNAVLTLLCEVDELLEKVMAQSEQEQDWKTPPKEEAPLVKWAKQIPPKRPWVGLTDDEIKEVVGPWGDMPIKGYTRQVVDKFEAKLKEKNT